MEVEERLCALMRLWSSLMKVVSAEAPIQVALRPSLGPTPGTRPGMHHQGARELPPLLLVSPPSGVVEGARPNCPFCNDKQDINTKSSRLQEWWTALDPTVPSVTTSNILTQIIPR